MIKIVNYILLSFLAIYSLDAQDYQLVWEDNFNAPKLDLTIWNIEENDLGGGNNELQYYHPDNVTIENYENENCLVLTAKKQAFGTKLFTSGRVNTKHKVDFKYGKIEARIKLPRTSDGLWPAFWLLGNDIDRVGWPKCGEIDIMEMGHHSAIKEGTQDKKFNGACHWGESFNGGKYPNFVEFSTADNSIQEGFHTYTLCWDADSIRMYLDKDQNPEPYYKLAISNSDSIQSPIHYFHKNYFVIFNLAVGGNYPEIWDPEKITALSQGDAKLYVDYIKVYQRNKAIRIKN